MRLPDCSGHPMSCDQFADRLNELLDDRVSPSQDQPLLSHAASCCSCDARLQIACQLDAISFVTVDGDQDPASTDNPDVIACGKLGPIPRRTRARKNGLRVAMTLAGVAAVLALMLVPIGSDLPDGSGQQATSSVSDNVVISVAPVASSDSVAWWRPADGKPWTDGDHWTDAKQWIDRSMPAVESVREGVAPIGRSLRRAVRILALGNRETGHGDVEQGEKAS